MADASSSQGHHVSYLLFPPVVHIIWGAFLVAGFIYGTMMQVTTTEAWMLQDSHANVFVVNFSLFQQFPQFWNGQMDAAHAVAFIVAWGVQFVLICVKIGMPRVQAFMMRRHGTIPPTDAMLRSAKIRATVWNVVSSFLIVWNEITDFLYASNLGFFQQLAFVGVTFLAAFYFGTYGVQQISAGLAKMSN